MPGAVDSEPLRYVGGAEDERNAPASAGEVGDVNMANNHVLLVRTRGYGDYAYLVGAGTYDEVMADHDLIADVIAKRIAFYSGGPYDDPEAYDAASDSADGFPETIDTQTLGDEVSVEDIAWYSVFMAPTITTVQTEHE